MSTVYEFLASPGGMILSFWVTFGLLMAIGLPIVFRRHDREMDEILAELRNRQEDDR